jgi:hypothetical protein
MSRSDHRRPGPTPRLRLESLEDRATPATFTVTNTADSGTGSLRDAITQANNTSGADVIDFAIPGAGVHTITPASALPTITDPLTIDGTTQPGWAAGAPVVELDGANAGVGADGLAVASSNTVASNTVIRGLVINRFGGAGVDLVGSGPPLTGVVIAGNFIGTDPTGTVAEGDGEGIRQLVSRLQQLLVGGPSPADRNLISGNAGNGIALRAAGPTTSTITINGNYIGTDRTGAAALPN